MKLLWWPLLFLACVSLHGQQNFVSISFGGSLPLGNYGETGNLEENGYARPGGSLKFDAGFFPVSYLGLAGSFSFGSNNAIRDSLLQDLILHVEENATGIIDIPEDAEILYGTGFWNYISLLLGPHLSFRPTRRLYLDFRIMGGISFLRPPDQELSITFDGTELFSYASNNKISLGLSAGTGIRYRLNQNLALKLAVDITQARSRFDYTFDLFRGVATDVPTVSSDFYVRTLEASVGLAYSF